MPRSWALRHDLVAGRSAHAVTQLKCRSGTRNWGDGSPAARLSADNFSARWTRTIYFAPGTYRLSVRADDGVQVTIDTQRVISEWHANDGTEIYTTTMVLEGSHTLVIEYFEGEGQAKIHFWYERISD